MGHALLAVALVLLSAGPQDERGPSGTLRPYQGPTVATVDRQTMDGKVLCGYQGWFNAAGDGAGRGWVHWTRGRGAPAGRNIKIDLWPDVSELGPDERFATDLKHPDGRPAEVFSSFVKPTVLRHFQWMREYGIDGAFVQRFVSGLRDPATLRHNNAVLDHCREGANREGRTYAVMYDLSGLGRGRIGEVIEDWKRLRSGMQVTEDPAYLHHEGKPVVTVWGIGFDDDRQYTLQECGQLVDFLKNDPQYGGCTVMLGVPFYWRELKRDCLPDPALHEILKRADVVSPWAVGRYRGADQAARLLPEQYALDLDWCEKRGLDYLPVVFPGFSWHNMKGAQLDQIPRQKGEFLWSQFVAAHRAGARMVYVAMFDEVDEGTAIFKCTNDVPRDDRAGFVTYEGLPSDFYLKLVGRGARLLRGEVPPSWSPGIDPAGP